MNQSALELGLLLHTGLHVRDDSVQADLRPVLDGAREAEELGFDHVWVGDSSRMERGWPRADCMGVLAALTARTERMRLGVIPLNAPLRDPVLLAHQLATLDVLSHGRLLVSPSVGKSGPEGQREFANCGIAFKERGPRFSEILPIMRQLWTEPSVDFEGRFYTLRDATVFPKPINRPIPLLVATGRDDRGLRRAGLYGDGWFTTLSQPAEFAQYRQRIEAYACEAGRAAHDVAIAGLYATFHLERDGDEARRKGPEHLRTYFGSHQPTVIDFFGSPAEIGQRLQELVEAGLTMVVIRFVEPDLPKQAGLLREAVQGLRARDASSPADVGARA